MNELANRLNSILEKHCRINTFPVAVKLTIDGEPPPEKLKYPVSTIGNRLAVCQGMSIVRTYGWTVGFADHDHACPLPRIFMGHIEPDIFLRGAIASYYQKDENCMKAMEAGYPRWPLGRFREIWLSPLSQCEFTPDLVVVYGTPAQILTMIHAANFGLGIGVTSQSTGRYGCAHWIAGVIQSDACTYMIPGPGERIFAGTQDHEMSFAIPLSKFDFFIAGMDYVRSKGAYKYPVPNLGFLSEPRIPKLYRQIEPEVE